MFGRILSSACLYQWYAGTTGVRPVDGSKAFIAKLAAAYIRIEALKSARYYGRGVKRL
ncbi:hypothetical protein GCM10011408_36990 [Dyella caseinilytica]|nr:hypothetical protein GCM10011408_36990 [Dyella caseinilytica]